MGFLTLPGIVAKAGYGQVTYLLTGEKRPENGTPKVKHPFMGPETSTGGGANGLGAFELAFRYDSIQAHEPGVNLLNNPITPGFVPTYINHTDQFTAGINWYLNYWVKYQVNWKLQAPYSRRLGLEGLDGLIALYRDYRALTDELYAGVGLAKLAIENSECAWRAYCQRIMQELLDDHEAI